MHIFYIFEIEQVIFNYLDKIADWNTILQINKYYRKYIQCNPIYRNIKSAWALNSFFFSEPNIHDPRFTKNLDATKYFYYKNNVQCTFFVLEIIFEIACMKGRLQVVKWLYKMNSDVLKNNKKIENIIKRLIENSNSDIIIWLIELNTIGENIDVGLLFEIACMKGLLEVAKQLYKIDNKVLKNNKNIESIIEQLVETDRLDIITWLIELDDKIDKNIYVELLFEFACEKGNLNIAKWLFDRHTKLKNYVYGNNRLFRDICNDDNLRMMSWLYKKVGPDCINNELFAIMCSSGYLKTAKWLYKKSESGKCSYIDVKYNNWEALVWAFEDRHLDVVLWLYEISE